MGNVAKNVRAKIKREVVMGDALLETDELRFHGDDGERLTVPFAKMGRPRAIDGRLLFIHDGDKIELELGAKVAFAWWEKITNPKGFLDKVGLKEGDTVGLSNFLSGALLDELHAAKVNVPIRVMKNADVIFLMVNFPFDLRRIVLLKKLIKVSGAIWIIRPRGKVKKLDEALVRKAARAAGLVDVKVAAYSATHTAEKWVIPVADREKISAARAREAAKSKRPPRKSVPQ